MCSAGPVWRPQVLVGRTASVCVDVLRMARAAGGAGADTQVLLQLARHSLDAPGVSWRVGVTPPVDETVSHRPGVA